MESSDVAQELRVKLMADLSRRTPESMAHLFNIMSLVLKRLLIDLDRSLFGREGMGAHYRSYGGDADSAGGPVFNDIASDEDDQAHPTDGLQYAEVLQLLDRLPKEQREAAQLYYLWDLTNEQVAEQLGVSTGKASGLISEARKALFRMYEGQTP
jgi:RNA polymerase sigma-70 factor (ECF subfamily)